jgi:hypothetical protein
MIGFRRTEKGAVPAVMKDNKRPNHDRAREHRQWNRQPPGNPRCKKHQSPERGIRDQRIGYLPKGASNGRLLVTRHDLFPRGRFGQAFLAAIIRIINHKSELNIPHKTYHAFCRQRCAVLISGNYNDGTGPPQNCNKVTQRDLTPLRREQRKL